MTKPDWDYWRRMDYVSVHQATRLAFNLEPNEFHLDKTVQEQLREGELILKSHLRNKKHFRSSEFKIARGAANMVRLSEYAAWTLSQDWSIPPELAALAITTPPQNEAASESVDPHPESKVILQRRPEQKEATSNWMLLVQAEAARLWSAHRSSGANPTRFSIRDDLARWCREHGVKTQTGINPSPEYIYRHALRKWTPPTV